MTLEKLWREFGDKYAESELVFSMNGDEAQPVRGAANFEMDSGEKVLYLTNLEGVKLWQNSLLATQSWRRWCATQYKTRLGRTSMEIQ